MYKHNNMVLHYLSKNILLYIISLLICGVGYANDNILQQAKILQHDGKFDEAIKAYKTYLKLPIANKDLTTTQVAQYTDALVQLMNSYQSKGEPEACITTLQEVFKSSRILQTKCLRDFHSVMGYALSRTERMSEAEETTLKVFTLPLFQATPERYFRDYAYAAAVFYSNPKYQSEVTNWCLEAMAQAESCENPSGKQWVTAMLGAHYKGNGNLNKALELFQQSKEEAIRKNDDLGLINSLNSLVDIFLYWNIPEYANIFASEAIMAETNMTNKNPMVSAQTYINKGWAMYHLGVTDSVYIYTEHARNICQQLPYNSGMVDVDLLHGSLMTKIGGDSLDAGIKSLTNVINSGTDTNRARAYHQLAQTYLRIGNNKLAEPTLDSMYTLITKSDPPIFIHLEYEPVLNYYLKQKKQDKIEQYLRLMLQEQRIVNEKKLNLNLIESIVDLQTEQKRDELKISQLKHANKSLWLTICISLSVFLISCIVIYIIKQKKQHRMLMKQADEKLSFLAQQINQLNAEEGMRAKEIQDFLSSKDNRHELETLTPTTLQTDGESKFRQYFELLHPLFLPRLREKVPSVTPREELLSMLVVLKQDNKRIAELMAIAPRSVLMLRHRFRQKIGMTTELSLEKFIEDILSAENN